MSHTLHRSGSEESLSKDFVILIMPENGLNDQNSEQRLRACFDILLKHNPVNTGDSKNGSRYSLGSDEEVIKRLEEKETIFAVYDNENDLVGVLKDLKALDCGLSVVISGLFEHSCKCAEKVGLHPHTAGISLGVMGKTELLPEDNVKDISVMCGHGLISYALIEKLVEEVRKGKKTSQQAAAEMAKCCICGVFNVKRAEAIISSMVKVVSSNL